jgi:ATP-dependent Lon protease
VSTETQIDVKTAREILDRDHYDMETVKDRIVEYLAVRRLRELTAIDGGDGVHEFPSSLSLPASGALLTAAPPLPAWSSAARWIALRIRV